jgi:hypothetical protein
MISKLAPLHGMRKPQTKAGQSGPRLLRFDSLRVPVHKDL